MYCSHYSPNFLQFNKVWVHKLHTKTGVATVTFQRYPALDTIML